MQYGKKTLIETYYEGNITTVKTGYEVSVLTDKAKLIGEMIDALKPISNRETSKVELEVAVDKAGQYRLIKRWTVWLLPFMI